MNAIRWMVLICCVASADVDGLGLERPEKTFSVFQFPANAIPRVDGDGSDWDLVPDSYVVGTNELWEDSGKHEGTKPESLDVRVKVGWVKGENRLYFLYEAYDDYWDFSLPGLKNDTFELVVDGDLSGGPLIDRFRENEGEVSEADAWLSMHGVHAQNYHIFTPAKEKDWCMLWGPAQWVKGLPYANAQYKYDFSPGEGGKLTLEFWITPFDYAGAEGAERAVVSELSEGKLIGLCWAIIDYDDVESERNNGFWNLSRSHTMYGKANELVGFRLMPLEAAFVPEIEARFDCEILDRKERTVRFTDESVGAERWYWDFGDGTFSEEQTPIHRYEDKGHFVVTLEVTSGKRKSRFSRVWDVSFK